MASLYKDPFTLWLESRQMPPSIYQPAGFLGGPQLGWKLKIGRSSLVYRVPKETPESLIIVLFEREGERTGLRSPFADIVRFITLIKRSGLPFHTIQGHVDALDGRPEDSLQNEKIAAFYKRYLAANQLFVDNGVEWVAGDLRTYVPPLAVDREWLVTEAENEQPKVEKQA